MEVVLEVMVIMEAREAMDPEVLELAVSRKEVLEIMLTMAAREEVPEVIVAMAAREERHFTWKPHKKSLREENIPIFFILFNKLDNLSVSIRFYYSFKFSLKIFTFKKIEIYKKVKIK
uniref:Uncharacterized protein n=1 Tax=Cacopsylla melanoneura TaxID=428564 RepID=A0A8D8SLV9_9HEMI